MGKLDDFLIKKTLRLGGGQCGSIFKATHRSSGDAVAAKEIPLFEDENKIYHLKQACAILNMMSPHENIISCHHSEVIDKTLWVVTEFCAFGNLDKYSEDRNLSDRLKLKIMIQIASAVQHLHHQQHPITHGDLKASKMLVASPGKDIVIKLIDCGLSKLAYDTQSFSPFGKIFLWQKH